MNNPSGPGNHDRPDRMSSSATAAILAGVIVFAAFLGLGLSHQSAAGSCASLANPTVLATTPVKHIFLLIKENHAFENYFGTLRGATGNPPSGVFPATFGAPPTVSPFALNRSTTSDLPHDHGSLVLAVDGGRMDGFVAQAAADGFPEPTDAVGYYTAREIPQYFDLAANYSVGDEFFSGILGPTLPNRLFDLAATSENWTTDANPPAGLLTAPTILDQLSERGLPWAYDYSGTEANLTPLFFPRLADDACAHSRIQPMGNLTSQLASATPPALTFLDPSHDRLYSEHPPANVTAGADWTAAVVNQIESSRVGTTSAIFIYYDECGGFWDPVPPPAVDALGDGLRVPLTVISPWTPAGRIVHTPLDPASLLRFVDSNFGLSFLSSRVSEASPVGEFFDFSQPPRSWDPLPTTLNFTSVTGPSAPMPVRPPAAVHLGEEISGPSRAISWIAQASENRGGARGRVVRLGIHFNAGFAPSRCGFIRRDLPPVCPRSRIPSARPERARS